MKHLKRPGIVSPASVWWPPLRVKKAIREIQKGDEVISLDEEGNKRVAKVALCITPKQMPIVEGLNVMFINGVAAEGFSTD